LKTNKEYVLGKNDRRIARAIVQLLEKILVSPDGYWRGPTLEEVRAVFLALPQVSRGTNALINVCTPFRSVGKEMNTMVDKCWQIATTDQGLAAFFTVGLHGDLFDLGGKTIDAMQWVARPGHSVMYREDPEKLLLTGNPRPFCEEIARFRWSSGVFVQVYDEGDPGFEGEPPFGDDFSLEEFWRYRVVPMLEEK
jgi:hypothetical protein